MLSIGLPNMLISDRYVFDWLKKTIEGREEITLKPSEIAESVGCHRHTVRQVCTRLESAGLIEIDRLSKQKGYVFRIVKNG